MWTRKQHIYSDNAGKKTTSADSAGKQYVLRNLIIVTGDQAEEAVTLAANDLCKYIKLACRNTPVAVKKPRRFRRKSCV